MKAHTRQKKAPIFHCLEDLVPQVNLGDSVCTTKGWSFAYMLISCVLDIEMYAYYIGLNKGLNSEYLDHSSTISGVFPTAVVDCQTIAEFTSKHPFDPPGPTIKRSHKMPLTPYNKTLSPSSQQELGIKSLSTPLPVLFINRS